MTRLLVALVFHSEPGLLRKCLESVVQNPPSSFEVSIAVCDTSSTGEARQATAEFGGKWHNGVRNAGYGWALNELVTKFADDSDICLLGNSDLIFTGGALDALAMTASKGAVCYPVQFLQSGILSDFSVHERLGRADAVRRWTMVGRRRSVRVAHDLTRQTLDSGLPRRLPRSYVGSGALIAMPAWLWSAIGGMNERLFLFEEDREFGERCHRAGIVTYLCGNAVVIHEGGFRGRGRAPTVVAEAALSERVSWMSLYGRVPRWLPGLQIFGCAWRAAASAAIGRFGDAGTFWSALRQILTISASRPPLGDDGLRIGLGAREEGIIAIGWKGHAQ